MAAAACLISATAFVGWSSAAQADPGTGAIPAARPPHTPAPAPTPAATGTPTPDICLFPPFCPGSPGSTPAVLEVSPVPPDPIPTPTTPSYLQGLSPAPSASAQGSDSGSSPLPVAGGFVVQPPTSGSGPGNGSPSGDLAPRSSGPPLPLLAGGALLVLGAIGSVMYALAPRNKPIFDAARRPPAPRPGPEGGA